MRRWIAFLILICAALIWPLAAAAQETTPAQTDDDVLIRINGPITVASDERIDTVIGINNTTVVNGHVEQIFIVNGDATINSRFGTDIVVISGTVTLGPNALVSDIMLIRSELVQQPGSTVTGVVEKQDNIFLIGWWTSPVFVFIIWTLFTIILLCGALIFVVLARGHLLDAAQTVTSSVGKSLLTTLIVWVVLPILGVLAVFTIIGIPLAITIYLLVLPTLWFLGYIVIGTRLGLAILNRVETRYGSRHLIAAACLGIILLQLTLFIPYVGGTIPGFAGAYGAGALFYHSIRNRPDHSIDPELRDYGPDLSM